MTMRSDLLRAVRKVVEGWGVSQTEAAKRMGVTQPRLNDLLRNRINKFSLDALVTLGVRAGLELHLDVAAAAASEAREVEFAEAGADFDHGGKGDEP